MSNMLALQGLQGEHPLRDLKGGFIRPWEELRTHQNKHERLSLLGLPHLITDSGGDVADLDPTCLSDPDALPVEVSDADIYP